MNNSYLKACEKNNCTVVRTLLFCGADVNWRRDANPGGLYIAARNNYGELLELLLAQTGVDVNIGGGDNINSTPMMIACALGRENIVRRLCQVPDIQLNMRDDRGATALTWAVSHNKPACVSVLREVADSVDWNPPVCSGASLGSQCDYHG